MTREIILQQVKIMEKGQYLKETQQRSLFSFQKKNEVNILQKFVQCKGQNFSLIRCFWSANSFRVEKVQNINQKMNKYMSIYQRYLTIEERHRFFSVEPIVSTIIQRSTLNVTHDEIQKYLKHLAIDQLQKDALDQSNPYIQKRTCPFCQSELNKKEDFDRRSLSELNFSPTRIIDLNKDMIMIQKQNQQRMGYSEFTLKSLLKMKDQQSFIQYECKLNKLQRAALARTSSKIPDLIRIIFPQMTENQYGLKEFDLQWQYKSVQTCTECFMKINQMQPEYYINIFLSLDKQDIEEYMKNEVLQNPNLKKIGVDFFEDEVRKIQQSRLSVRRASRSGIHSRHNANNSINHQDLSFDFEARRIQNEITTIKERGQSVISGGVFVTSLANTQKKKKINMRKLAMQKLDCEQDMINVVNNFRENFQLEKIKNSTQYQQTFLNELRLKAQSQQSGLLTERTVFPKTLLQELPEFQKQYYFQENSLLPMIIQTERSVENPFMRRINLMESINAIQKLNPTHQRLKSDSDLSQNLNNPLQRKIRTQAVKRLLDISKQQEKNQSIYDENNENSKNFQNISSQNSRQITLNRTPITNIDKGWLESNMEDLQSARDYTYFEMTQNKKSNLVKTDQEQKAENIIKDGFKAKTIEQYRKSVSHIQIAKQAKSILDEMKVKKYYREQQQRLRQCEGISKRMGQVLAADEIKDIVQGGEHVLQSDFKEDKIKEKLNKTQLMLNSINKNLDNVVDLMKKKDINSIATLDKIKK
ncbi:UNKNOWN [Stylonychia lemnae]|uniref:Uncharacterized protein n=1 Tax=Stylonychia lemnae TaxID=5949 RepID=A0A078AEW9_STYLE|nr:UNKNOWN [Stylonychia lemnae]|eukprot:CDW80814.1 UNKNOWN [Stylonychia lemnae]